LQAGMPERSPRKLTHAPVAAHDDSERVRAPPVRPKASRMVPARQAAPPSAGSGILVGAVCSGTTAGTVPSASGSAAVWPECAHGGASRVCGRQGHALYSV
jgi:hypothetical protein